MPTFTASIEAEDADESRAERAMTDDDIRAEYEVEIDDTRLLKERLSNAHWHGKHEADAMTTALSRVVHQARQASRVRVPRPGDPFASPTTYDALNLDGAVLTIEMHDFVATATLVLPDDPHIETDTETGA